MAAQNKQHSGLPVKHDIRGLKIMPPLSDNTKLAIDALSKGDLRREIDLGRNSRFQREKFAYLKTSLAQREEMEANEQQQRDNAYRETEIHIANESNAISRGANLRSTIAIVVSIIALLVALGALLK